ncbi:hypothetical protein ACIGEP_16830 [Microbacterium sp. NPDC077663]|uniref:hypothetical protein n=1 Tax=Microbacterium sp. NPDC077663 TaxID=3364189 RepID=UPI0037C60709
MNRRDAAKPLIPSGVWIGLTIAATGGLAWLVIKGVAPPTPVPGSYFESVQYVLSQSLFAFGAWAAVLAFVGAVTRALAQNGDEVNRPLDYVGKLFGVAAASLAFWVAVLSWPALNDIVLRDTIVAVAAGGALLALAGFALIRREHKLQQAPSATAE